jgi:hypothetical protein
MEYGRERLRCRGAASRRLSMFNLLWRISPRAFCLLFGGTKSRLLSGPMAASLAQPLPPKVASFGALLKALFMERREQVLILRIIPQLIGFLVLSGFFTSKRPHF